MRIVSPTRIGRLVAGGTMDGPIASGARWPIVAVVSLMAALQMVALHFKPALLFEWRPADLASIALNYYRHGFAFLYPQILWGGSGPGYVEMECPLIPYLTACLYLLFGVRDWVALLIPMASGLGLSVTTYLLAKRSFGELAGLIAGLLVALSPTVVDMSTGLWPDVPPLFIGTLGLYFLMGWVEDDARWRFRAAVVCIALAPLLKLTALYVGLPVLFLLWTKYRAGTWRAPRVWLFAAVTLLPSIAWYAHAYSLAHVYGNTFGILAGGYLKFASTQLLTSGSFYARTLARVVLFQLTPMGACLAACGLLARPNRVADYLVPIWLINVVFYLGVVATGVSMGHHQYALPIVPPSAVLGGRGAAWLLRWLSRLPLGWSTRTATTAMLCIMGVNAAAAMTLYQARGTDYRERSIDKMRTGLALKAETADDALIVVVDGDMNGRSPTTSMTPPEVFYFADRRGWYRAMDWLDEQAIEDLRQGGARYLAVSLPDASLFRAGYPALYNALGRRYHVLFDDSRGILYELMPERSAP